MTKTITGTNGTIWYRNPCPDSLGNKWIRIVDCITLMRNGFAISSFPKDMRQAIEDYIEKRKS